MAKAKFYSTEQALNAIFGASIPLFAQLGYSGVSVRQVANAVDISIATIYHHFENKENLYLQTIKASFKNKAEEIDQAFHLGGSPQEQLHRFIFGFTKVLSEDSNFERLIHREMLEGNRGRLQTIVANVFEGQFLLVMGLAEKLFKDKEPHMTAMSIFSLIFFHIETSTIREFFPGYKSEYKDPKVIAEHIIQFING